MYDGISCTAEHSFREIVPEKNLEEQFPFCLSKSEWKNEWETAC